MDWSEETVSIVDAEPSGDPIGDLSGRVIGDFSVGELIGRGGNGVVYRARQHSLDRDVVIKFLRHLVSEDTNDRTRERFLREAQLASGLDHPYAAHIYGFGIEPDGLMWIAMELVRGTGLDQLIKTQGALPVGRLVPLLEKICEVVHTAHAQGIVHRDIKPSNVMVLSRAGRLLPKLLDFGIARRAMSEVGDGAVGTDMDARAGKDASGAGPNGSEGKGDLSQSQLIAGATDSRSTPRGASLGSPLYMAPEQWQDASRVDAYADQYALGILAYEALTGQLPFRGSSMRMVAAAHTRLPVPSLGPEFSTELDAVMQRVLAKKPSDRFDDVMAFARAMREASLLDDERQAVLQLDGSLVALYSAKAPQPLADSVASLDASLNQQRAIRALSRVIRASVRLFGIVALSAISRIAPELDLEDVHVARAIDILRSLRRERASSADWLFLLRGLLQPFIEQPDVHPMPELVLLLSSPESGSDTSAVLDVLAAFDDQYMEDPAGVNVDMARAILPELARFLQYATFVCDYEMAVVHGGRLESWSGARRAVHPAISLRGTYDPPEGTVLLVGANAEPLLIMSPLIELLAPAPGSPSELFLFDGAGQHGAIMTSYPADFHRYDLDIWPWFEELPMDLGHLPGTEDGDEESAAEVAPYMGLSPFSRADASRFFGREREIESSVNRLLTEAFLAVVGPSGAGKSSFVQAGMAPALPYHWHTLVTRPGASPMTALSKCVAKLGIDRKARRRLWRDPDALGEILRRHADENSQTLVVVIDQFEELVTLCPDLNAQQHYAESLMRATRNGHDPVRVIITLRDDFLLRVQQITPLSERLGRSLMLLATPPRDQLERIVIEPAKRAGYEFDDDSLVREMVAAVVDEPGALALLSFTASKLWERRDRHFKRLTRRDYEELGGVGGALAQHAESILDKMSEEQRALVREVFRQLVTAQGTRAILTRRELEQLLGGRDKAEPVLETLIGARLLVASESTAGVENVAAYRSSESDESNGTGRGRDHTGEGENQEDHVEVVHEALLSSWPRLVAWQREDAENVRLRDQLRVAARQWHERGRPKGLLWRGEALLEYRVWRARYPGAVTRIENDFAAASLGEYERGQRIRKLLVGTAFVAMLAVVVVVMYFNQNLESARDQAEAFAQEAEKNRTEAERLAHTSQRRLIDLHKEQGRLALFAGQPMRAFVYLREALASREELGNEGAIDETDDEFAIRFMLGRAVDELDGQELVIEAGERTIWNVRFSPNGELLASTGDDGKVKLWNSYDGRLRHELVGHTESGFRLEFNSAGSLLASSSWDDTVRMWDPHSGAQRWVGRHDGNVMDLAFSGDDRYLATASRDGTAKIWVADTGELRQTIVHEHEVTSVVLDRHGEYLASGTRAGVTHIWHIPSGRMVLATEAAGFVLNLAVSPDYGSVASGTMNGPIYLLPFTGEANPRRVRSLLGHEGMVVHVAFSPDGRLLASGGLDGTARLWDTGTTAPMAVLDAHSGGLSTVHFSAQGDRLLTTGEDGTAKLWSWEAGVLEWTFVGHRGGLSSADIDYQSGRFATSGSDSTVRVWRGMNKTRDELRIRPERLPETIDMQSVALDPGETRMATAHSDGSLRLWTQDGAPLRKLAMVSESEFDKMRVVWHPDGSRLLGSGGAAAVEWDAKTGARIQVLKDQGASMAHAIYTPDGRIMATAGADGTIALRDSMTGEVQRTIPAHESVAWFLDFDARGERLLSVGGAAARTIKIWRVSTGELDQLLVEHAQNINTARFSPDGTHLAVAPKDKVAEIWSLETGDVAVRLEGHGNEINDALFSPDGRLVATASSARSIEIWDASSGSPLWSISLHQEAGTAVQFSRDGRKLLGAATHSLKRWNVAYETRSVEELDRFATCRVNFVLARARLERVRLDYQGCFDRP